MIGNPHGRRVELFQAALARREMPPARVVAWADLLAGSARLEGIVRPGDVFRLESPGKDFEVERAILALGADAPDGEDSEGVAYSDRIPPSSADSSTFPPTTSCCAGSKSAVRRSSRRARRHY